MTKTRITAFLILFLGAWLALGFFGFSGAIAPTFLSDKPFRLGLDLAGGTHLTYVADISAIPSGDVNESMEALRDVIERRVNLFGVAEPVVQTQSSRLSGVSEERLSVELPGVTDITKAIKMIGQTPFLEFKVLSGEGELETLVNTELTGKYLKRAAVEFNPSTGEPMVSLYFDSEGAKLFEKITSENIEKPLAIFLDGKSIVDTTGDDVIDDNDLYAPIVREAISGGQAQISGNMTPEEAKTMVGRLNAGALPVPISLISTQSIGATLGSDAIMTSVKAGIIGFMIVAVFLLAWYRLPGLAATLALAIYVVITLALYKLIPITLTAAGLAGFIISIGMAVDANILIFERTREERAKGESTGEAMKSGYSRAWHSIRDGNTAAIIVAIILFWFGTPLIKGFALTLGLGVFVSLLSAITITKYFLNALPTFENTRAERILFSSGFGKFQK